MSFAERNGFVKAKAIQVNDIDDKLRNRLYNAVHTYCQESLYIMSAVVDRLGYRDERTTIRNWRVLDALLLRIDDGIPWYMPYEVIESFFAAKREYCENECRENGRPCQEVIWFDKVTKAINAILEEEKSGYRIIDGKFVNIVSEIELEAIKQASSSPYAAVNMHIKKALSLYSDRKNPDYENSIKESISAVEAMCCIITGMSGAQATLGNALKHLEDSGVILHGALKSAFEKMYGYTSDADGIRHGGIDFKNAPSEDAKYMLITCSAFVNYLIEKHIKTGEMNE